MANSSRSNYHVIQNKKMPRLGSGYTKGDCGLNSTRPRNYWITRSCGNLHLCDHLCRAFSVSVSIEEVFSPQHAVQNWIHQSLSMAKSATSNHHARWKFLSGK